MADEEMERNSPQSTSQATPPQVDDSPEMANQPSSPEEGISSSTDRLLAESPDSPDEPEVSSTSEAQPNAAEGSPTLSDSDASQEIENQSPPGSIIRRLLESPPAMPRTNQSVRSPVQNALIKTGLVGAAVVVPSVPVAVESAETESVVGPHTGASSQEIAQETIEQNSEMYDDSNQQFDVDDSSSAPKSSPENANFGSDSSPSGSDVHEDESRASESTVTETSGLETSSSPRMGIVKENICSEIVISETVGLESRLSQSETSPDMQVSGSETTENMEVSKEPSPLKSDSGIQVPGTDTTENMEVSKEPSPLTSESGIQVPGTDTTENMEVSKEPSPLKSDSGIKVPGRDTTENMEISKDSSPLKSDSCLQVSGKGPTKTVGLTKELSPSKTSDLQVSASGTLLQGSSPSKSVASEPNTPERRRGTFSPKRKSPTNSQHSSPKRYAPLLSPDKKQSDSQMSTLLEELDIQETENNPESSQPTSEQVEEMSSERAETDESQNEDDMEVQETD